jgi:hypothetical protein
MKSAIALTQEQTVNLLKNAYCFVDNHGYIYTSYILDEDEIDEDEPLYFSLVNRDGDCMTNHLYEGATIDGCFVTFQDAENVFETFTVLVPAYDPSFLLK